jgi:hypothetical protein
MNAACELIAAEVLTGWVNLAQRIDAEDERRKVVRSLPFPQAVTISGG